MRAVQTLVEAAPAEAVARDEAGTDRMKLYFCFEGCPVSNRFAGTFWYVDQQAWYYESSLKSGALMPVTDESLLSFSGRTANFLALVMVCINAAGGEAPADREAVPAAGAA